MSTFEVWDGQGTILYPSGDVDADGYITCSIDTDGDGERDGWRRVLYADLTDDDKAQQSWDGEGTIVDFGEEARDRSSDLGPSRVVQIDDDGDGVADRRATVDHYSLNNGVGGGDGVNAGYGANWRDGSQDPVTTDVEAPAYLDDNRQDVQSGTGGSFEGPVVVSAEAFAEFTDKLLFIADNVLTADRALPTVDVGPGGTPMGLALAEKLNTESGTVTRRFIKQAGEIRDILRELAADLTAAASVYKKDHEKIVLDAAKLEGAFQEALSGISSGVTAGAGDSGGSDSGDSDSGDSDSDSSDADSDSEDSDS